MLPRCRYATLALLALLMSVVAACERSPLLAPTGSTITLTSPMNVLPADASVPITALVLEAAGTPPHSGTHVTFTTTLGRIVPAEAETDANGRATASFVPGGASGMAVISAISGGATTSTSGGLRIAVGTAGVGAVRVSASPASVPALGGSVTITANVFDVNGNALGSAPVVFSTTAGTLSGSVVNTDPNGVAQTILTTSQQATVTAAVGAQGSTSTPTTPTTPSSPTSPTTPTTPTTPSTPATSGQASGSVTVTVNAAPTLVITPPTTSPSAGIPAPFTFAVTAAGTNGSAVRGLRVNWGDGSTQDLGAVSGSAVVSHTYQSTGSYLITATITDASGNVSTVSSSVNVIPVASPTIVVTPNLSSCSGASTSCSVTFTIQVTPPTGVVILSATIDFGDGTSTGLGGLTGSATIQHTYVNNHTAKTVTLTIVDTLGRTTQSQTVVVLP